MNDLPDPSSQTPPAAPPQSVPASSGISKEVMGGPSQSEFLQDVSGIKEIELPKEVASAGVKVQPTTVKIPQPVAQMGVKHAGPHTPVQTQQPSASMPLTDDQIAQGLTQGITSSWRWLSEWCVRRLKKLHIALQVVSGRVSRVQR